MKNNKALILNPQISANCVKSLVELGFSDFLFTEKSKHLTDSTAAHVDMLLHTLPGGEVILENSQIALYEELKRRNIPLRKLGYDLADDYPRNIPLNCFFTANNFICNTNHVDCDILSHYKEKKYNIIHTNQGYAKCSALIISENAIITDDRNIYTAVKANNIDVLLVSKGSVELEGYDYGFIGGCSGKISEHEIVFFGDFKKHSDYSNIKAFCENYRISLYSLDSGNLIDFGGLVIH